MQRSHIYIGYQALINEWILWIYDCIITIPHVAFDMVEFNNVIIKVINSIIGLKRPV